MSDKRAGILYARDPGFFYQLLSLLLAPLGWLYGGLMRLRAVAYRRGWLNSYRPLCKVVCVGNLTMGGTGKTPVTVFLARALQQKGRKVAVVSRGYRGSLEGQIEVVADGQQVLLTAVQAGDEPAMIARALPGVPVIIGARRPQAVRLAEEQFKADVVICDDAFSHLALQRDCDVVLVHGRDGLGNGRCTPAGPLREPPSALGRADLIVLNTTSGEDPRTEQEIRRAGYRGDLLRVAYGKPAWRRLSDGAQADPAMLDDPRAVVFAATARPKDVFSSFAEGGMTVAAERAWPDHHAYTEADLQELSQLAAQQGICYLATTEKDAVKLPKSPLKDVEVLVAEIVLTGPEDELQRLVEHVEESCCSDPPSSSIATEQ